SRVSGRSRRRGWRTPPGRRATVCPAVSRRSCRVTLPRPRLLAALGQLAHVGAHGRLGAALPLVRGQLPLGVDLVREAAHESAPGRRGAASAVRGRGPRGVGADPGGAGALGGGCLLTAGGVLRSLSATATT